MYALCKPFTRAEKKKKVNWSTLVVVIFDLSSDMVPEQGISGGFRGGKGGANAPPFDG